MVIQQLYRVTTNNMCNHSLLFILTNFFLSRYDKARRRKRRIPKSLSSKGEIMVAAVLDKLNLPYETQYELGYAYHADFAIHVNGNLSLIEYDGSQHYKPSKYFGGVRKFIVQRMHDIAANRECRKRGIPLLRIRYDAHNIEHLIRRHISKYYSTI